jgi:DNA repair protein RecO (recombination protein O)
VALVSTPAVVLRTYRYSETSKVVRLATRELGIQSAIAKGALRPKSRFGAGLELLSEGTAQLYYRDTRELQTLAAFDLANLHRGLAADVGRFAAAAALAQVMLAMAPPAPLVAAYDTFTAALAELEATPPGSQGGEAAAVRAMWLLLAALGFGPSLEACARDGAPVAPGDNGGDGGEGGEGGDGPVVFSVAEGGALCPRCAAGPLPEPATRLPRDAYRDLRALNDPRLPLPRLDPAHAAAHRRLVARFVRYHGGEPGPHSALDFWERRAWVLSASPPPVSSAAS